MAKPFDALVIAEQIADEMGPILEKIRKHSRNMWDQAERSTMSIPNNVAEGARRRGADRLRHYRDAAGSAAELRQTLRRAVTWKYVAASDVERVLGLLDRELAILWRLTNPRPSGESVASTSPAPGR